MTEANSKTRVLEQVGGKGAVTVDDLTVATGLAKKTVQIAIRALAKESKVVAKPGKADGSRGRPPFEYELPVAADVPVQTV